MEDIYDALLFGEGRPDADDRLEEDPELARAWAHWVQVRTRLRERLDDHLPDRRLLVLYVLEQEGDADLLTPREAEALEAARDDIARAIETVPALEQIIERIRDERADFLEVWAAHSGEEAEGEPAASPGDGGAPRADRAARPPRSRDRTTARRWARRLALAVVLVGMAVVTVLFWPQGPATTTVTVAEGDRQVVELDDGSTVRLVGEATLTHPASLSDAEARTVTLEEGRAFFNVPSGTDPSRFTVETPTAAATVLGTQFAVTTRADTTSVVLAEGSVRVSGGAGEGPDAVTLEPGQHSRVVGTDAPARPAPVDLTEALEWTGLFVFRSLPLSAIADRLSRRYDANVTVAESLADEAVTGTFERDQPVEQVLEALAATLGADVQTTGNEQYRIVPAQ